MRIVRNAVLLREEQRGKISMWDYYYSVQQCQTKLPGKSQEHPFCRTKAVVAGYAGRTT